MEMVENTGYSIYPHNQTVTFTTELITNATVALNNCIDDITCSDSATTPFTLPDKPYSIGVTALLATLAAITSFCTTIGNIMVVISFVMERQIRQPSNYLIASLAVTDIIIGGCSMPLYTMYLLQNYWPLGVTMCNLWLSMDYTVCLVSQYTVFLITLDRFCSVKIPAKYRNWRTKCRIKLMIAVTWVLPAGIFFTTIMGWETFVKRQNKLDPYQCEAEFQTNKIFSATLVICYYWITLVVMIVLYVGIYKVALGLHKRARATKKRLTLLTSTVRKHMSKDAKENESLLPSPGMTTSTQVSNDSNIDPNKVINATANSVATLLQPVPSNPSLSPPQIRKQENYLSPPTARVERNSGIPPQSLAVDVNLNSIDSKTQLNIPVSDCPDDSPIWKPRNSLPNTSIHWDALKGGTFHRVEREDFQVESRDESNKDISGSASLSTNLKHKRQSKRRKRSERSSDGRSRSDYNDSSSETSDSDNKPKTINQLSSMVAFLSPKVKSVRKKPSIQRKIKSENRARKALRTITFILGAFVICWTPYHVIVLLSSFCKTCDFTGPLGTVYQFSYWLCYMNSPLNPFCYALSNPQFKKSFIKILNFGYLRQCWRKLRNH